MPNRDVMEGDEVFIRARVLQHCGDAIQVQISDFPKFVTSVWVPAAECAKAGDIWRLRRRREP